MKRSVSIEALFERARRGDQRAISRLIRRVEDDPFETATILPLLKDPENSSATSHVYGIAGSPGVGKSSLISRLLERFVADGKQIAVLAVDPTSPISGGALLGDRVRMQARTSERGVFIRSMASRGSMDGLARSIRTAIPILSFFGYGEIIVETVGIGQVETAVRDIVDTLIQVVSPDSGDEIQLMKAGMLELADILVLNKGDKEGADRMFRMMEQEFANKISPTGYRVRLTRTEARVNEGVDDLYRLMVDHRSHMEKSRDAEEFKASKKIGEMIYFLEQWILSDLHEFLDDSIDLEQYKRDGWGYIVKKREQFYREKYEFPV